MKSFCGYLYRVQKQKKNSKLKAYIVFSIGILQILSTIIILDIENREKFHVIEQHNVAFNFLSFIKYVDVEQLCYTNIFMLTILVVVSLTVPLIYLITTIFILNSKQEKRATGNSIEIKFTGVSIDLYFWCLFQPLLTIEFEIILFNKELMNWDEMIANYYTLILLLFIFALLGFLLNLVIAILIIQLFHKNQFYQLDYLSNNNPQLMFNTFILKVLVALLNGVQLQSKIQYICYILILMLFLMKLYYDHFFGKYEPSFNYTELNYYYQLFIYTLMGLLFSFLIEFILNYFNIQISYGFLLLVFILFFIILGKSFEMRIFFYFLLVKKKLNYSILLNKIYYSNLLKSKMFIYKPLMIGIIQQHVLEGCQSKFEMKNIFQNQKGNDFTSIQFDTGPCFCKQHQIYDAKRKLYITCNLKAVTLNYKSFFQFQIKSLFEQHLRIEKFNCLARLNYAKFLFYQVKNKSQSLKQLSIINDRQEKISILDKIQYFLTITLIQNQIAILNQQSYKTNLDFENVLIIEQIIRKIKFKIGEIIQHYLKFWKQINSQQIDEQELIKQDNIIEQGINDCEKLWSKIIYFKQSFNDKNFDKKYLNKKPQWEMMYLWYKRYILNKRMKGEHIEYLPFNNFKQQSIDEDSDSEIDDHVQQVFNSQKVFDSQTAIIVVSDNGKITKINENGKQVLQVQNLIHINQLIPSSMIRNHMLRVQEFIDKGKSNAIYNRQKILLQNPNSYLIPANKYLKIIINQLMSLEYIAMIRPLTNESTGNYLIINEDWEVVQCTKLLTSIFNKQFNLILSCPKLLLNSSYSPLLEKDDFKLFQIKNPQQDILNKQRTVFNDLQKQKSIMIDNVFEEIDQEKQFTEQFLKENEDDLEERQRILNCNINSSNEKHFQLLVRIPIMLQRMQAEYFNLVTNADKENFYDFPENSIMKRSSIIVKQGKHVVGLNRQILLQKIKFLKQLRLSSQLEIFRYLYRKYFCKADSLKKVIRVDAKIKLEKIQLIDKIQVIKINRFEIFNNTRSKKQSMLLKSNPNKRTLKIDQNQQKDISNFNQKLSRPSIIQKEPPLNLIELSQRNHFLLLDSQLKNDFSDSLIQEYQVKPDVNLFIKEDHNKIKKHFNKINYFKWTNRYFMVGMILLTMLTFSYGPNCSEKKLNYLGANTSYSSMLLGQDISITYNILIDVALCNKNETLCNYLISYINLEKQEPQLYNKSLDIILIKKNLQSFYGNQNFIQTINDIILTQHEGENHQSNILEDLRMFENVLNQLNVNNNEQINLDFQFLYVMQTQIMPGLFESLSIIQQNQLDSVYLEFDYRSTFILVDMIIGFLFLGTLMSINFFHVFKIIDDYQILYSQIQYFDVYSIDTVIRYYSKLKQNFSYLNDQVTYQSNYVSFQSEGLIKIEADQQLSLAQKNAQFKVSQYWFRIKLRSLLLYFIFMLFLIIMALTYNVIMQLYAYNLKTLISENSFLQEIYSPWAIIFSKELFIEEYFQIHNIQTLEYKDYLQNFVLDALNTNQNLAQSSNEKIQNYFDNNLCEQLQVKTPYCQEIQDGVLRRGLVQTYYQLGIYFQSQIDQNKTTFSEISFDSIYKWNYIQPFLFQQQKNIWKLWNDEFQQTFEYYRFTEVQLIVCFYVFSFAIYLITLEFYFESQLRYDYRRVRSYYKRYFPNHVMNEQKRIKALLKKQGLV